MSERAEQNTHEGFTPGPWRVYDDSTEFESYEVVTSDGRTICITDCSGIPNEQWDPNARLIADSPRLLAENAELRQREKVLVEALEEAIRLIEFFHGPEAWELYAEHSPEMKRLTAALTPGDNDG